MIAEWQDAAACQGHDRELFFTDTRQARKAAITICELCDVRSECLQAALENGEEHGVWGGMTAGARRKLAPSRRRVAACGSDSGYYRHRYFGEPSCAECRAAHSLATSIRDANPVRNAGRRARYWRLRDHGWCNWCAGGLHAKCQGCTCDRTHEQGAA